MTGVTDSNIEFIIIANFVCSLNCYRNNKLLKILLIKAFGIKISVVL